MADYTIEQFKGIKNDEDRKNISLLEGYFYDITNFQYTDSGLIGMEEILYPERISNLGSGNVDGLFEYRFLDSNNDLQIQQIGICDGNIYKDVLGTKVLLKSGITKGKCSFLVFNDKLYIANGKDYIWIYDGNLGLVSQMGAPFAITTSVVGNPSGTYYYAVTYVTAGGEEVIGSVSNSVTVVNNKVLLNIPIGYSGTLTRNLYRTINGGIQLKLVANIPNNTTLTYTDDIADVALGANIPVLNNELPKPQFLTSAYQKILATCDGNYPTQVFQTDTNVDVIDTVNSIDVANYGTDNTPIMGIGSDFNNVVVGTKKNIVFLDASGTSTTVSFTRANIGMKDGFSICNIPSFGDFPGGLMFVSSENDVRMIIGLNELPVATSLGNIRTQDWAQDIRGTLSRDLSNAKNISVSFYKYKYYLQVDSRLYTFDVRTKGWSKIFVKTIESEYISNPLVFGVINNILYNGQPDGYIEQQHVGLSYRSENVSANMVSGSFLTSDKYKNVSSIKFWFLPSKHNDVNITVTTDSNEKFYISQDFKLNGGVFNSMFYNSNYYDVDERGLDYKVVNINRSCRWLEFEITNSEGNINFYKYTISGDLLLNKEASV